MVKGRPTPKARTASTAKRASSSKAATTSKEERKTVDPTKLAWSTVHLPSEAQSGGAGVTESDFFDSLNWNDDDFMGLQEIDDVDVLQETRADGSRTISFLASDKKLKKKQKAAAPPAAAPADTAVTQKSKAKKQPKKRKIEQVVSDAEPESTRSEERRVGKEC